MIMKVVSNYDKKLGIYSAPICVANDSNEDLIEKYRRMCASDQLDVKVFDFDVYVLGTFDDKLGQYDLLAKPEFLVSLGDYRYLQEKSNGQS